MENKQSPEPKFTILVNRAKPKTIRRTTEVGIRLTSPRVENRKPVVQDWPTPPPCVTPSHSSEETNSTEENLGSFFS